MRQKMMCALVLAACWILGTACGGAMVETGAGGRPVCCTFGTSGFGSTEETVFITLGLEETVGCAIMGVPAARPSTLAY